MRDTVKQKTQAYPAIFDPDIETLPPQELYRRLERPHMLRQFSYALEKSPFYQAKLKDVRDAGRMADNLASVPFTEKSELIDDQTAFPPYGSNLCVGAERLVRVHRTSGTTGRPYVIALTRADIETTSVVGARCFWASGLRPGHMVFHCLNYCMWIGGYTDHQSLEKTGAAVVPYGVGNSSNLVASILDMGPTAIHCTLSYLKRIEAIVKDEFHLTPRHLKLKLGLFGGEGGLQDQKVREQVEQSWGIRAMDANYGVSDVLSMLGGECERQDGFHFMGQGKVLAELVRPENGEPVAIEKGVIGELVLTNLEREAEPLIRFRTHDVIEVVDHNRCECGRASFRFKVLGRSDDMVVVKGLNVYPGAIASLLSEHLGPLTGEFQMIVERKQPVEKILVRVEYGPSLSETSLSQFKKTIDKALKDRLGVKAQTEMVAEGQLPRTEGKAKRLVWLDAQQ